MKIIFKALSAALLFSMISGANADFMRCEGLTADQQTQADFCSAHIACKIAVKIMKSCADVTAYYADFFSETKGKSQEELARQTPPVEKEPEVAKVRYYSAEEIKQSRKDQISAYEKEDRELAAEMRQLNCGNNIAADKERCMDIGNQALYLHQRVRNYNDTAGPDWPQIRELQTDKIVGKDSGNFLVYYANPVLPPESTVASASPELVLTRRNVGDGNQYFEETLKKAERGESLEQQPLTVKNSAPKSGSGGELLEILAAGVIAYQQAKTGQRIATAPNRQESISSGGGRLSVQQCHNKIVAIHSELAAAEQANRGNDAAINQAVNLSNQLQISLFEGECSHHPQARQYVTAAGGNFRSDTVAAATSRTSEGESFRSNTAANPATSRTSTGSTRQHDPGRVAKSYKNERTGEDCVKQTRTVRDDNFVRFYFENSCGRIFTVHVFDKDGKPRGSGILAFDTTFYITCRLNDGCGTSGWTAK